MPRKKSASGRSRVQSAIRVLSLKLQKVNKRLRSLKRAGNLGSYKSKELLNFVARNRALSIKKGRKGKFLKIILSKVPTTIGVKKEANKKLAEILSSRAFSNIGVEKIRKDTRRKIKQTLKEQNDRAISDSDVDKFIEIAKYLNKAKQDSLKDRIDPSDFFALVSDAKTERWSLNQWINQIGIIANIEDINDINNITMRNEAIDLYNRYVA